MARVIKSKKVVEKSVRGPIRLQTIREVDAFCLTRGKRSKFWPLWWAVVQDALRMKLAANKGPCLGVAEVGKTLKPAVDAFKAHCRRRRVILPALECEQFLEIAETVCA